MSPFDPVADIVETAIGLESVVIDAEIEIDCSWTDNRNFLKRSFKIKIGDGPVTSGMHFSGWDPAAKQFRNWNFYSDGGFSDVVWKHEKDRWYMHYKGVGADGQRWTAVGIIKPVDKDTFTWQLTERTADGKPDLSGIWRNVARPANAPAEALGPDGTPMATFRNIGAGFKDGLPLRPWAKEVLQKRMADNSKDNPDVWCLPLGNQQFNAHTFPRKVIQTPGVVLILYETHQ